jgi:hypothetical protein
MFLLNKWRKDYLFVELGCLESEHCVCEMHGDTMRWGKLEMSQMSEKIASLLSQHQPGGLRLFSPRTQPVQRRVLQPSGNLLPSCLPHPNCHLLPSLLPRTQVLAIFPVYIYGPRWMEWLHTKLASVTLVADLGTLQQF